jgi:hypothetical protein
VVDFVQRDLKGCTSDCQRSADSAAFVVGTRSEAIWLRHHRSSLVREVAVVARNMAKANLSWDTLGPFLVWQFLIPLVGIALLYAA